MKRSSSKACCRRAPSVGFAPSTRADDGDPLDVLVLMDAPVFPGCIVPSRLIGVIEAEQTEDGKTERNDRLLAVAVNSAAHRSIETLSDLSQDLVAQIEHFFVSYNEMKGKRFRVKGQAGNNRAFTLVKAAMKRRGRYREEERWRNTASRQRET
jgi:inorganic pyrophosphatase